MEFEKQQDFRKVFVAQVKCSRLLQLEHHGSVSFYLNTFGRSCVSQSHCCINASIKIKVVDAMLVKEIKIVTRPKSN